MTSPRATPAIDFKKINRATAFSKTYNINELKNDQKFRIQKRPIGQMRTHILDQVNISKVGSSVFDN